MSITRWAFNIRQPLLLEHIEPLVTSLTSSDKNDAIVPFSNLLSFLPKLDCDRLLELRQEEDMRRALVGRLMIHAFFTVVHGARWENLVFSRTEANKPVLVEPAHLANVSFNISHHGDWVLFAGANTSDGTMRVGVDIMDFQEQVPGESFETFLSCFQDQFTAAEQKFMYNASSHAQQLRRFYRLWCLKESVVKAIGVGIDYNLKALEFTVNDPEESLKPKMSTSMQVLVPQPELTEEGWSFEEALLDDNHCYAIAIQNEMQGGAPSTDAENAKIQQLDWKELLKHAVPYPSPYVAA
ncbi:hypothetical protein BGZ73_001740 [Actinomortierella ambigua]|nr:hypothetical protein BGZ73_001740 [Actinomortierella ambigua]